MKYCETCHSIFPSELDSCPRDKQPLRQAADLMPGMIIREKYEVLERIGIGGMAAVYKARHLTFNEIRAIKVVNNKLLGDVDFLKRFKYEAVITRKLRHPNAVQLDDFDVAEDGRPFIVMEYVQGRNLRSWIHGTNPIPIPRALNICRQVAAALGAAHKLNIVHRDIKPDNILLIPQAGQVDSNQDLVKVLDFGIAKMQDAGFEANHTVTQAGLVVGTPQYVSPEQASGKIGEQIDGRSDLYSLGIMLFEMITGKLPFNSETPIGFLVHHLQTQPKMPSSMPQPVAALILRALEKDRLKRFQTAEEMANAMARAMNAPMGPAVKSEPAAFTSPAARPFPAPAPVQRGQVAAAAGTLGLQRGLAVLTPLQGGVSTNTGTYTPEAGGTVFDESRLRRGRPVAAASDFDWKKLAVAGGAILVLLVALAAVRHIVASRNAAAVQTSQDDSRILQDVNDALAQSEPLKRSDVHVEVKNGVVKLTGTVDKPYASEIAGNLAGEVQGVRSVSNQIQVVERREQHEEVWRSQQHKNSPDTADPPPNNPRTAPNPTPSLGSSHGNHAAAEQYVSQGYKQMAMRDFQGAAQSFQRALQLDPGNQAAQNGLQRARKKGN